MRDYSKGVIYTINCLNQPNDVYVGSTIQLLSVRMRGHKKDYKKNKVLGINKDIVKDINDWVIQLYEVFPCNSRQELCRREGEVIREIGTLNKRVAGRTYKEWRTEFAEEEKQRHRLYREKNKDYHQNYYQRMKLAKSLN